MGIEERITFLESELQEAVNRLTLLEAERSERYLTVAEFSKTMDCGESTVYQHISKGTIKATRIGGLVRIPMSQFALAAEPEKTKKRTREKSQAEVSMKQTVFG